MKLKRWLSAALALGMVWRVTVPALAAETVSEQYAVRYHLTGQSAELELTGLPAGAVCSVQLELTLDGVRDAAFTADAGLAGAYTQAVARNPEDGETRAEVTLYLDSLLALNDGETLALGTLSLKGELSSFGGTAGLILLDEWQKELYQGRVKVLDGGGAANPPAQTGSAGSGGASHVVRPAGSAPAGGGGVTTVAQKKQSYEIRAENTAHGAIRLSPSSAKAGETVTVTAAADPGYTLSQITVSDSDGGVVSLRETGDGVYAFTMPEGAVRVQAEFAPLEAEPAPRETELPFRDVAESDWFYDAVRYVYERGMMSGTSATAFSPDEETSRAMVVSILHRLEGSPAAGGGGFPDVPAGQYYTAAAAWAAASGIVSGYSNGQFRPNDRITREQLASILYRYAAYKGYPTAAGAGLEQFPDRSAVSAYAVEPMSWAVGNGLISGNGSGALDPAGGAARGQLASVLTRFCQTFSQAQP